MASPGRPLARGLLAPVRAADVGEAQADGVEDRGHLAARVTVQEHRLLGALPDRQARLGVLVGRTPGHPVAALLAYAVELAEHQVEHVIAHEARSRRAAGQRNGG